MYFQVIMNLLLVIIAVLIYLYITWKVKSIKSSKGDLIEVASMLAVGPKEKIILVKVENQKILIGVTPGSMTFLSQITNDDTKPSGKVHQANFRDVLDLTSQHKVDGDRKE